MGLHIRTLEPARALAAETFKLERTVGDLVNQAYGLTPARIDLMWKTAPPRMPVPPSVPDQGSRDQLINGRFYEETSLRGRCSS